MMNKNNMLPEDLTALFESPMYAGSLRDWKMWAEITPRENLLYSRELELWSRCDPSYLLRKT